MISRTSRQHGGHLSFLISSNRAFRRRSSALIEQRVLAASPLPSAVILGEHTHFICLSEAEATLLHWYTGPSSTLLKRYGPLSLRGSWNCVTIFLPKHEARMKTVTSPTCCPVAVVILKAFFIVLHGLLCWEMCMLSREFMRPWSWIWWVPTLKYTYLYIWMKFQSLDRGYN